MVPGIGESVTMMRVTAPAWPHSAGVLARRVKTTRPQAGLPAS
jgi:hypothetical protein